MRFVHRRFASVLAAMGLGAGVAVSPAFGMSPTPPPTPPTPSVSPSGSPTPTETAQTPTDTPTSTDTPTPTKSPSPTKTPPPTKTPTPPKTPTPTKTPKPTKKPTGTPTPTTTPDKPTDKPPEQPPDTLVPDDVPSDPDTAYQQAIAGAQTVAVAEARRLLAEVMADVDTAQVSYALARSAADAARREADEAQRRLKVAEESAARTERQIADLVRRTESTRDTLGLVAREAYKGTNLAALGVVLAAETPAELTTRYVGMRTLLRTGDSTLGRMAVDEAELRNAYARLTGQRVTLARRAEQAATARQDKEAAEQAAEAARGVLDEKSALVASALDAAEQARLEDYSRYMALLNESTAIGARLAGLDYGPGYGTGTFLRPGTGSTTSEYGPRLHPILGYVKLHTGLDFGRGDGAVYAADSGTVVEATWNTAYGNMVIVDHGLWNGQRLTTMYAHQRDLAVAVGQKVEKGQVIGTIGSTGYSTGPHLHFEVRLDGNHTDPWPWVADAPAPG